MVPTSALWLFLWYVEASGNHQTGKLDVNLGLASIRIPNHRACGRRAPLGFARLYRPQSTGFE
jgi:hypothetical protein